MTESALYGQILLALSRDNTRLFRQQSALAWAGKILSRTANTVTIINPHAIKLGTDGISDFGGLTSVIITPDMIGHRVAIYLGIEVKSERGRVTPEQANFVSMVNQLGGRAGIARSVEDAANIIAGKL